ncbi:MAG TPA: serine hydrolase domain-containing protein [Ilumatobacteraceae bacterium]|nr:serine hydrolase domain-containing protein [Ilumatobacteraceae bacterium]
MPDPAFTNAHRAFDDLAAANPAVTMTVARDGRSVLQRASGATIDGAAATSDSPMVVASVSKLLTALMIARLEQAGTIDVDAPVAWAELPIATHPDWTSVTVRELLAHTSGMPVVRPAWFDGEIDCAAFLPFLVEAPPTTTRGRWAYSNGNYCALGLLIETATGLPLDRAAQSILLDPLGRSGVHLTTDGQRPIDVEYRLGVGRLSRLGGAGAFIVSTDDIAGVLAGVTPTDLETLRWPGILADQYGWGHTGSVDGAAACAWVLEGGRTVVAATIAGGSPATGGAVCDRTVPAVAEDLGVGQGRPDRSPP